MERNSFFKRSPNDSRYRSVPVGLDQCSFHLRQRMARFSLNDIVLPLAPISPVEVAFGPLVVEDHEHVSTLLDVQVMMASTQDKDMLHQCGHLVHS